MPPSTVLDREHYVLWFSGCLVLGFILPKSPEICFCHLSANPVCTHAQFDDDDDDDNDNVNALGS